MTLRALEPQDLELLYTIENDREQWQVADTNAPYSRYDLENYILSQQHDVYADKQLRLVVCDDKGSGVGLVDLFNFSPANKRAELGLAILKSEREKVSVEHVPFFGIGDDGVAGDDTIQRAVVGLDGHLVDKLEVAHNADGGACCRAQQSVIEALAAAQAVALGIKCHGRHDDEFQARGVDGITHGLPDVELVVVVEALRTVIGDDFQVVAHHARQVDVFAGSQPLVHALVGGQFVGQRPVAQDVLCLLPHGHCLDGIEHDVGLDLTECHWCYRFQILDLFP